MAQPEKAVTLRYGAQALTIPYTGFSMRTGNGTDIALYASPRLISIRTSPFEHNAFLFVPLRVVVQALGGTVEKVDMANREIQLGFPPQRQ